MKLHNLRDFVTVADTGGIRAAARQLNLSQPALSKSISQLEHELGTPLFVRSARGSILNTYGERFLIRAKAVMQELARGGDEIRQMRGSTGGSVTFAASSVVAMTFLSSSILRFRRRFPDAMIMIREGPYAMMLQGLHDRSLDFAIGPVVSPQMPDNLMVEPLFENTRRVIGRRGHPLADVEDLKDLTNASWLMTSAIGPQDDEFRDIFNRHGLDAPTSLIRCESLLVLLALLAETDALAFLPRQWATARITEGLLASIPVRQIVASPTTCLITPRGMPLTPAAEALADALRTSAVSQVERGPATKLP